MPYLTVLLGMVVKPSPPYRISVWDMICHWAAVAGTVSRLGGQDVEERGTPELVKRRIKENVCKVRAATDGKEISLDRNHCAWLACASLAGLFNGFSTPKNGFTTGRTTDSFSLLREIWV